MRNFIWFVFTLVALATLSCQDEDGSVVQDTTNNFSKTSPISSLIKRVSQYGTTTDNVLDGTSNCSIKLPVEVTVNNQYIYVIDSNDFQQVQDAKNNYPGDDVVHFGFPITIVYPNYQEYYINSQSQMDYIFSHYGDDSSFHEISCIHFDLPIHVNIYNTDNQVASAVTVSQNEQLYNLIDDLNDSQLVGIVYPIILHNSNGQAVTITNNTQLEDAINTAVTDCSSGSGSSSLSDSLTTGTWHITYFYDENDETYHYTGYNFTFNTNGSSLVVKNTTNTLGDWQIQTQSGLQRLVLQYNNEDIYLHELEKDWEVQENTATYIRLRHEEGGGQCHYLDFTKNN